jgi:hypothetical protein
MYKHFPALAVTTLLIAAGGAVVRAQDLDDITHVHPAYTLSQMRPAAWQPQVAGMDLLPDGRMLILEMQNPGENTTNVPKKDGVLYLVDNPDAANAEDIKYHILVNGLAEPVGVLYQDGKVYISEKNELNEYTLDAGFTKATKARTVAKLPHDSSGAVNFQEYSFGTLYKDGYFYVVGGGSVRQGGKSFDSTMSKLSEDKVGAVLKIKGSDGTTEALNCGLRASNGIAWGPEGTIWVTDNQGSYRPASEFTNIVTGANYGYPNKTSPFSSKAVTPPSVWMVHAEIGRSPTYPHLMEGGPYAGQFLVGDISQGGIKRIFVEKVNNAWQGAAFSFTGGLEVGIETLKEGPNGVIYIGGMGKGDVNNWGWNAKLFGLQKLTPKAGTTVMEILSIRSRKNGMEIEFSQPVGAEGEAAGSYNVQSGAMVPQSDYGAGSMVNKAALAIKAVQVSTDRKKVFLQMDVVAKQVLIIKTQGVKSQTGEAVRCPAGWYTLNNISPSAAFEPVVAVAPAVKAFAGDIKIHSLNEGVRVSLPFAGAHELTLKTLQGRTVASHSGIGARDYLFDRKDFRPGVYMLEVKAEGSVLRKALLL